MLLDSLLEIFSCKITQNAFVHSIIYYDLQVKLLQWKDLNLVTVSKLAEFMWWFEKIGDL